MGYFNVILIIREVKVMGSLIELFNNYGYIVLLIALILELLALPLPGETLMTYCGYVIYGGKMNLPFSILIATIGVCIGITLSYVIGRTLGVTFFEKYGHYIHMDKNKLDKTSMWFEKYGNKMLILAYFIPGVRHVTGYFAGIMNVPYKKFAVNAYAGALIWTTTFISLGNFLGVNWVKYHHLLKRDLLVLGLIIAAAIIVIYLCKVYKLKKSKIEV
jgi:membrane protein DedA with SNARE-associated domain